MKKTNELIEHIRSHNNYVVDALAKLIGKFRFKEIVEQSHGRFISELMEAGQWVCCCQVEESGVPHS